MDGSSIECFTRSTRNEILQSQATVAGRPWHSINSRMKKKWRRTPPCKLVPLLKRRVLAFVTPTLASKAGQEKGVTPPLLSSLLPYHYYNHSNHSLNDINNVNCTHYFCQLSKWLTNAFARSSFISQCSRPIHFSKPPCCYGQDQRCNCCSEQCQGGD